jgi:TolB-like protein/Tfp pilus assembly protein PilF
MSLLAELKRRNVLRVAALYLVGAWLVVQVAETLLPIFHTPDWVLQSLVVLLALAFLPALVLAWVFELTPQGIRLDADAGEAGRGPPSAVTTRRLDLAVIIMLILVGGMTLWQQPGQSRAPDVAAPPEPAVDGQGAKAAPARSIAVLAFADLSAEGDQQYFAEGISEELLNLLARIEGLQVAARTSSFKFRDGTADIGEIGRALGVDAVVEGSVRKAGGQIRITAQLINTHNGFHLWSQSYDRRIENIFAVQDEIAAAVVDALKLKLDLAGGTAGRTANVEAHDLYLRGLHAARTPKREQLLQAVALYEAALTLDPAFAAAYGGIAEAWIWLEDYGGFRASEALAKAEQAARRALALDPRSAEANAAMAMVHSRLHSDHVQAAALFEQSLAINPNYVIVYTMYADALRELGQARRMVEMQRRAVELDPLSNFYRARLAARLIAAGQGREAEAIIMEMLAAAPDDGYALEELGNLRRQQGRLADAAESFRRVHDSRAGDPYSAAVLAMIGAEIGDSAMAEAWTIAARERGEDNSWELRAREMVATWQGDWQALDVAAGPRGRAGAHQRGVAAIGEARWADAREVLEQALREIGYSQGQPIIRDMVAPLTLLAWLDRREDKPEWVGRTAAVERFLRRLQSEGGLVLTTGSSTETDLARVAAISGDRELALAHLRAAFADRGFRQHWFLQRDPVFETWRADPDFLQLAEEMRAAGAVQRERIVAAGLDRP